MIEADFYRVRLHFERLFADPSIFEDQRNVAGRYLLPGTGSDKTVGIYQITSDISPTDDFGKPSKIGGTARYVHRGRVVRSEYFENANVILEYADFDGGISPNDHKKLWRKQKWGRMAFSLKEFHHQHLRIDIPDISELYEMLCVRADPTTLVDVELPALADNFFRSAVGYIETRLKQLAEAEHQTVEIYVAKDLLPEEKQALENRLTRPSTQCTIYIMLSKAEVQARL